MGIQFFSYFCSQTKDDHCGHSLELPYLTCTHNLCFEHKQENNEKILTENCHLTAIKICSICHRCFMVMNIDI